MKKCLFKGTAYAFALHAILLFVAGCNDHHHLQVENRSLAPDTLWTPTGDAQLDSLLQLAAISPQDTNLVWLYDQIGDMYKNNDSEKAKAYYQKEGDLSEQLDWSKGRYLCAANFSTMFNREGLPDSAIVILQKALELAVRENNELWKANQLTNLGNSYFIKGWYETALVYYMEGLPFFERENNTQLLQMLYYMMCQIYRNIGAMEKAIEFGEKSVALNRENPNSLYTLAGAYSEAHQREKADGYYQEALRLCKLQNNSYVMAAIYYCLGFNAMMSFDLDKAEKHVLQSLEIYLQSEVKDYCLNFMLLGKLEQLKGNYTQSEEYVKKALQIAEENENLEGKQMCYTVLCELTIAQHKYRENIQYWGEQELTEIAKNSEKALRAAEDMSAKYETEKKELKISALEEERRLMIWRGIAGGAILLLALAASLFLWRWTVQKRQLAENRIRQLEQGQQLIATQAVLDGETAERARLARDLHDGLGGKLIGVKMHLQELRRGAQLDGSHVEKFNKAMDMLDDSVREMRRVSHNLMPIALNRYGLKPAVSDFCRSTSPLIVFGFYGDETRLDSKLEMLVYRCIHELVNNALKYSGASQIMVQIMQEPDRISFSVQDDGCGFDPSATTQGTGLQNVRTRVASFGGKLMIDSKAGVGTEITVDILLDS